jgi:hypothetical protein
MTPCCRTSPPFSHCFNHHSSVLDHNGCCISSPTLAIGRLHFAHSRRHPCPAESPCRDGRSRFSSIKLAVACCRRYQGLFALSSPPQVYSDNEMYLSREQTPMESSYGYPMAVGHDTTLEGENNNPRGVGSLTAMGGTCPSQSTIILL